MKKSDSRSVAVAHVSAGVSEHPQISGWRGAVPEEALQPDVLLPSQTPDALRRRRALSPEVTLAVAVLERAALDLRDHRYARRRRNQALFVDAFEWVLSSERRWPFSFESICELLGFSPESVRAQLLGDAAPPVGWTTSLYRLPAIDEAA